MSRTPRENLDELDQSILKWLKEDARMSNTAIARHAGTTEKTVRARIKRLHQQFGLRFSWTLAPNPASTRLAIAINCNPGQRFETAEWLGTLPQIERVFVVNGEYDLIAFGIFDEETRALDFQTNLQKNQTIQSFHIHKIIQDSQSQTSKPTAPKISHNQIARSLLAANSIQTTTSFMTWAAECFLEIFRADRVLIGRILDVDPIRYGHSVWMNFPDYYKSQIHQRIEKNERPGIIHTAISTGRHVYIPDALLSPMMTSAKELIERVGYRTVLCLPLRIGKETLGIATLYYDHIVELDDEYISTTQAFLDQGALKLALILNTSLNAST